MINFFTFFASLAQSHRVQQFILKPENVNLQQFILKPENAKAFIPQIVNIQKFNLCLIQDWLC